MGVFGVLQLWDLIFVIGLVGRRGGREILPGMSIVLFSFEALA